RPALPVDRSQDRSTHTIPRGRDRLSYYLLSVERLSHRDGVKLGLNPPGSASVAMARRQLSPFMIPVSHADLQLTAAGPTVRAGAPITFGFTYAGIAFEASAELSDTPVLEIRGRVGTLPFSAEGVQRRIDLKSIIVASRDNTACRFTLDERQQIWLDA